jgi:hypothetical protein
LPRRTTTGLESLGEDDPEVGVEGLESVGLDSDTGDSFGENKELPSDGEEDDDIGGEGDDGEGSEGWSAGTVLRIA